MFAQLYTTRIKRKLFEAGSVANLQRSVFKGLINAYYKHIGTHGVRELFCSCQEGVRKWLLNERACTKVHYWDVVYLSSVEHSKSIGF